MNVDNSRWPIGLWDNHKQVVSNTARDFDLFGIAQAPEDAGHRRPMTHDENPVPAMLLAKAKNQAVTVAPRYAVDSKPQQFGQTFRCLDGARCFARVDRGYAGILQAFSQGLGLPVP